MAPPPVSIYVTSLTSQPKVRQNIELLRRSLRALEIPYTEHDLVMEEEAKTRWQRAKPTGQIIGLPGYLVGGEWVGTMDDFEYAAETSTLPTFLRQDTDLRADQSIGEAELERLMREMSDADLDALAEEVGKSGAGKPAAKSGTASNGASGSMPVPDVKAALASVVPISTAEGLKGISTAASTTIETITQKASEIVASLGGAEAHSGTADSQVSSTDKLADASTSTTSGTAKPSAISTCVSDASTGAKSTSSLAASTTSPAGPMSPTSYDGKGSRLSKEEIAEKMMSANSVEGLLASLDLAGGKEKVD